jgi:hypothetical protein
LKVPKRAELPLTRVGFLSDFCFADRMSYSASASRNAAEKRTSATKIHLPAGGAMAN